MFAPGSGSLNNVRTTKATTVLNAGSLRMSESIVLTHKPRLHVAVNKEALPEGATAITAAIDAGYVVGVAFIDFKKAFDCVDHGILLNMLRCQCGIRGSLLNWLTSYLTSGSHGVKWTKIKPLLSIFWYPPRECHWTDSIYFVYQRSCGVHAVRDCLYVR